MYADTLSLTIKGGYSRNGWSQTSGSHASMIMEEKKCKVDRRIFTKEIYMGLDQPVPGKDFLRMRY